MLSLAVMDIKCQVRTELASAPPMGWNSWNWHGKKNINEQVVREIEAAKIWGSPIVTQLLQFQAFYKAEDYHQGYFDANPQAAYCQAVIVPKVVKFRKRFAVRLKSASKHDE